MDTENTNIGEIAKANNYTAWVMENWGLAYGLRGKPSVSAACKAQGLQQEKVLAEFKQPFLGPATEQHPYDGLAHRSTGYTYSAKHYNDVEATVVISSFPD